MTQYAMETVTSTLDVAQVLPGAGWCKRMYQYSV